MPWAISCEVVGLCLSWRQDGYSHCYETVTLGPFSHLRCRWQDCAGRIIPYLLLPICVQPVPSVFNQYDLCSITTQQNISHSSQSFNQHLLLVATADAAGYKTAAGTLNRTHLCSASHIPPPVMWLQYWSLPISLCGRSWQGISLQISA